MRKTREKSQRREFGWRDLEAAPPGYWLQVCKGREAAQFLFEAGSIDELLEAVEVYPTLLFPGFLRSVEALSGEQTTSAAREAASNRAALLRDCQRYFRTKQPLEWSVAMARLGFELTDEEGGERLFNLQAATLLLREARSRFPAAGAIFARCQMQEALVRQELGDGGLEPEANWDAAVGLYEAARKGLPRRSVDYAACLVNEANVRLSRAEHRGAIAELNRAIALYRQARPLFPDSPENQRICKLGEGNALTMLAELGVSPERNLKQAIERFAGARIGSRPLDIGDAQSLVNEAAARIALADQGTEPERNLTLAVEMLERSRSAFNDADSECIRARINEGNARCALAERDQNAIDNLHQAIGLYRLSQRFLAPTHPDYALCLMNEGAARTQLAELGVDSQDNWQHAAALFETAYSIFPRRSLQAGRCRLNEGAARRNLADLGIHPEPNLKRALALYQSARKHFPASSLSHARSLMNEATTRLSLAEWGFDRRRNLRQAAELYRQASDALPRGGVSQARCRLSECNARTLLAETGSNPEKNLREAIALARAARNSLRRDAVNAAACETNEARALFALANFSDQSAPLHRAARLARKSAETLSHAEIRHEAMIAWQLLGTIESHRHRWPDAHQALLHAIEQAEGLRYQTQPHQRQNIQKRTREIFEAAIAISLRSEAYGEALEEVEWMRSRGLSDLLAERERRPRRVSSSVWEEWRRLSERLTELDAHLQASLATSRIDGGKEERESERGQFVRERTAAVARLDHLEGRIRAGDPEYRFAAEGLKFEEMQETAERLKRALVSFHIDELGAAIFILRPGCRPLCMRSREFTEGRLRELLFAEGDAPGWASAYQRYVRALSGEPSTNAEREGARWRERMAEVLRAIYAELLGPLHQELRASGERRAVFIAGGLLGVLPLHAAAWEDAAGELRYLIEELEIGYAPSIAILRRCLDRRRPRIGEAVVASTSGNQQPPLGYAGWEANRIASLLRSREFAGPVRLLGEAAYVESGFCDGPADVETFLSELPRQAVCHLACHGVWRADAPLESCVRLAGGEPLTLDRLFREARLNRAQFVALSACESSLGLDPEAPIEEYRGLPAGFLSAGARCVVGSLWVVSDFPAALLMVRLHHDLIENRADLMQALQRAQQWAIRSTLEEKREFLRQINQIAPPLSERNRQSLEAALVRCESMFSHPSTWAAFQAIGAPLREMFVSRPSNQRRRKP